jgi:predicted MFS family arabinose efflux permease
VSVTQAIAGSCNSSCARAVTGLGRIIGRYLWYRFHYWSIPMAIGLSIISAFAKAIWRRSPWH